MPKTKIFVSYDFDNVCFKMGQSFDFQDPRQLIPALTSLNENLTRYRWNCPIFFSELFRLIRRFHLGVLR